jgi:hypothetical protein
MEIYISCIKKTLVEKPLAFPSLFTGKVTGVIARDILVKPLTGKSRRLHFYISKSQRLPPHTNDKQMSILRISVDPAADSRKKTPGSGSELC